LHGRFEALSSLAYFEHNDEGEMEAASKLMASRRQPMGWMPVGGIAGHSSDRKKICDELHTETTIEALLNAGFAKKSRRFLQLFIENLNFNSGLISP
jgi:hypothetical protein